MWYGQDLSVFSTAATELIRGFIFWGLTDFRMDPVTLSLVNGELVSSGR